MPRDERHVQLDGSLDGARSRQLRLLRHRAQRRRLKQLEGVVDPSCFIPRPQKQVNIGRTTRVLVVPRQERQPCTAGALVHALAKHTLGVLRAVDPTLTFAYERRRRRQFLHLLESVSVSLSIYLEAHQNVLWPTYTFDCICGCWLGAAPN